MTEKCVINSPLTLPSPARGEGFESPSLDGRAKGEGDDRLKSLTFIRYFYAYAPLPFPSAGEGRVKGTFGVAAQTFVSANARISPRPMALIRCSRSIAYERVR